jgi:serine/threonine-protein kinase RsbW
MPLISPRLARSYEASPHAVADARAAVRAWLRTVGIDGTHGDDIVLAVSEACSNVVMHAYAPGVDGRFRVFAEADRDQLTVTVCDDGRGIAAGRAATGGGLGLGLPLIATLADSVEARPGPDDRGTELSMRFAIHVTTHAGRH